MPDLLTSEVAVTAGPLVIETFVKHYLTARKHRKDNDGKDTARIDLMYDEDVRAWGLLRSSSVGWDGQQLTSSAFTVVKVRIIIGVAGGFQLNKVKSFLLISTHHSVAALQQFSLAPTPSPPWVAVHRVKIPQHSLSKAAEKLVEAFGGEEMAFKIAGGSRWWQVRAGPGVEAEWIVPKSDWRKYQQDAKKSKSHRPSKGQSGTIEDAGFVPEMDRLRCMLYIHGGAYYWGSINTHRYTIWRYARKMNGRCFAVNYRKAPQYPFPCAIQDCLAAYLYLVNPPPGAEHHPVHPQNIVIAGDSAGGGLTLALLQILRDTPGLELPAGAVLLSPWSDLTHSFPSILTNTETVPLKIVAAQLTLQDVIPPYGFIHKPSSLWPPPSPELTDSMQVRIASKVKLAVNKLRRRSRSGPSGSGSKSFAFDLRDADEKSEPSSRPKPSRKPSIHTSDPEAAGRINALFPRDGEEGEQKNNDQGESSMTNPADVFHELASQTPRDDPGTDLSTLAQCTEPLHLEVQDREVIIDTQIQLYATNAQLCHPWVSPVLGYLGGLPPLYILAGDSEVLRDEILYLAHKAAHPAKHPIRDDVKALLPSLNGIEERSKPTNVHLQVYDGVGHDLPLFSMTRPARGAFRAVAEFCRFVTPSAVGGSGVLSRRTSLDSPVTAQDGTNILGAFPLVDSPVIAPSASQATPPSPTALGPSPSNCTPSSTAASDITPPSTTPSNVTPAAMKLPSSVSAPTTMARPPPARTETAPSQLPKRLQMLRVDSDMSASSSKSSPATLAQPKRTTTLRDLLTGAFRSESSSFKDLQSKQSTDSDNPGARDDVGPRFERGEKAPKARSGEAGWPGIYDGPDPFTNNMIRERVDFEGICRPLEPEDELGALTMPPDEVGKIKEGPALRYLSGQALFDRKFKHQRKRVQRHRERNLRKAQDKDLTRIAKLWGDRVEHGWEAESARSRSGATTPRRPGSGSATISPAGSRAPSDVSSDSEAEHQTPQGPSDPAQVLLDGSWSWQWAAHGEAPPPSAIVSRRDLPEGRQLALMADRVESTTCDKVYALPIWAALTSFFTSSADRQRAHEEIHKANDLNSQRRQSRIKTREEQSHV